MRCAQMRLGLELVLVLGNDFARYDRHCGSNPLEGYMHDDTRWNDWARNAKGQIDKKREAKRLSDQTLVTTQNILERKSPLVWANIRREIQDMCKALNEQMGEEVLASDSVKSNEVVIRVITSGNKATARFIPETNVIEFVSHITSDILTAEVRNGEVVFALDRSPQQPHEIAKKFMDSVVAAIS
jgi:hypothetical protein